MSLAIERLHIRASLPRRLGRRMPELARIARDVLPRALVRRFAVRVPSRPAVCRIRRLHVRVKVSAAQLDDEHVAEAWAEAFCAALLTALHQPPERDVCVAADSRVEWLVRATNAVLDGRSLSAWPLAEFAQHGGHGLSTAVLGLARDEPGLWPDVLAALARTGDLERLIRALGPHGCHSLAIAIESGRQTWPEVTASEDLVRLVQLAAIDRRPDAAAGPAGVEAMILRLIAAAANSNDPARPRYSPSAMRTVVLALEPLARLLNEADGGLEDCTLTMSSEDLSGAPELPRIVRSLTRELIGPGPAAIVAALRDALAAAVPDASRAAVARSARTRRSQAAGLFLLVSHIERLEWPERIRRSRAGAIYGSGALSYFLFGVMLKLLSQRVSDRSHADGGVSLLAGWLGEPNLGGAQRFAEAATGEICADLIRALDIPGAGDAEAEAAPSWDEVLDRAGSVLVRELTRRLRGLTRSSHAFIVDRVLKTPGTIEVDDREMLVRLAPSPLSPVVHISGEDAPVDSVSWLGGRRLVWHLEGL